MQGLQGQHHLRGRTVGAGNDSLCIERSLGIDFGHDESDVRIHPPVAGFVNHSAAGFDSGREEFGRRFIRSAADEQIDALEAVMRQFFDRDLFTGKIDNLPGAAGGGQEAKVLCRELPFGKKLQDNSPYGTSRAGDGHGVKHRKTLSIGSVENCEQSANAVFMPALVISGSGKYRSH
jgi:hypothetical protein